MVGGGERRRGGQGLGLGLALLVAAPGGVGCASARTGYAPEHVAAAELTLRYEGRMEIYAGRSYLTSGPRYRGLAEYVRCVPIAYEHARYAERHGRARVGLAWSGGALGIASLGGLSGFAFLDEDPALAFGLLGSGLAVGVAGIILAAASRSAGNRAHGNAIDALNYYNDAVGSLGERCGSAPRPAAAVELPRVDRRVPPGPPPPRIAPGALGAGGELGRL